MPISRFCSPYGYNPYLLTVPSVAQGRQDAKDYIIANRPVGTIDPRDGGHTTAINYARRVAFRASDTIASLTNGTPMAAFADPRPPPAPIPAAPTILRNLGAADKKKLKKAAAAAKAASS